MDIFQADSKEEILQKDFHCPPFQIHPRGHRTVTAVQNSSSVLLIPDVLGRITEKHKKPQCNSLQISSSILHLEKDSHQN